MPGYIYAQNKNDVFVNLFVSNNATIKLPATDVKLTQQTDYPWQGKVNIAVDPAKSAAFAMHIRIPGWATDEPVPGDLYSFISTKKPTIPIYVNGKKIAYTTTKGYAVINRTWKKGDQITVDFPMEVEKVTAIDSVKANKGRFALQRGPIVYCLEGADQTDSTVQSIVVDTAAAIKTVYKPDMLNGITTLTMQGIPAVKEPKSDNTLSDRANRSPPSLITAGIIAAAVKWKSGFPILQMLQNQRLNLPLLPKRKYLLPHAAS